MADSETYKAALSPLPAQITRWHLHGAGLDALQSVTVPLPDHGPDEMLVRFDACGICFSDVKIVNLGPDHPRLQGRDMGRNPVVMGHEVSLTVAGVGGHLQGKFQVGQRFVVQPDVYYEGRGLTFGYQLPGGMAQYGVITRGVLEGDQGCHLLPVAQATGYAEAALTELWACVVAAYEYSNNRDGLLDNGKTLIVNVNTSLYGDEVRGLYPPGHQPADVVTVDNIPDTDFQMLRAAETNDRGFDDIVVYGTPTAEDLGRILTCLASQGILNFVQDRPMTGRVPVDVGRVHYEQQLFVGTSNPTRAADAYSSNTRTDLLPGGAAWFVGAGGPLGQMHVQRAVMLDTPPRAIVVSDLSGDRLARLQSRFGALMAEKGIVLHLVNPGEGGDPSRFGPFDDIVCLAPDASAIEESIPHLAIGGVYNLFAGIAKGTMAHLELGTVLAKNQRLVGSSGSSLAALRRTLEMVEARRLDTNASVAAIGGLGSFRDGLAAVQEGRFPGKVVIFPQLADLPLLSLDELKTSLPQVYAKLQDGRGWTVAAEQELLREPLG